MHIEDAYIAVWPIIIEKILIQSKIVPNSSTNEDFPHLVFTHLIQKKKINEVQIIF
jgi:hypothetical protein